jgi:Uma2 family endonuclease
MRHMALTVAPSEERVLFHNISWETYERLLAERGHSPGTKFAYDEGNLEIMVAHVGHENPNRTLAAIVEITAEETRRDFVRSGSTTFKRQDLAKGFEPDSSFYFRQAELIRGKEDIDLSCDPSPELVIEIDISRSSLNRFPIFAAIGVAEIWRYDGRRVQFYALEGNSYGSIDRSSILPPMTAAQATVFLEASKIEKSTVWLHEVREWVRAQI